MNPGHKRVISSGQRERGGTGISRPKQNQIKGGGATIGTGKKQCGGGKNQSTLAM